MHHRKLISVLSAFIAVACLYASALAASLPGPLVDTRWLEQNRAQVKVIDARGDMQSYAEGHIPNAAFMPFKDVRATSSSEEGIALQDMHLSKEAFEELVRRAGINTGDAIIVTHPGNEPGDLAVATYVYWQLKYYGHDNVALLDGGTAKWMKENREIAKGPEVVSRGNFSVQRIQQELLATTADTKRAFDNKSADLLDARPMGQYLGLDKRDYVDALGHIPGAKVLPFDVFMPMGMGKGIPFPMKPAMLRAVSALSLSPERAVITYCNTGHMASVDWFVLHELLGFKSVALFDGSMHAWAKQGLPTTLSP